MIENTDIAPSCIKAVARNEIIQSELDRANYQSFLTEYGITEEDALAVTELGDVIQLPIDSIEVRASQIQGDGLFAKQSFSFGDLIAPALLDGKKTQAGRFVNHSAKPNAKMVVRNENNIDLLATKDIHQEEITTSYRETLQTRAELIERNEILQLENAMQKLPGYDPGGGRNFAGLSITTHQEYMREKCLFPLVFF